MQAPADGLEARIAAVRRFSRFYTRELGLLRESLVETRFSLTESRVLYELAHRDQVTASELAADGATGGAAAASASLRRHGLGDRRAWCAVREGIRFRHQVRGAGRPDRGRVHREFRFRA